MTLQKIEFEYDIPEGYRFVRYGKPEKNDSYVLSDGKIAIAPCGYVDEWVIVEKIPEQEQSNEELKLQFKNGDGEWIDLISDYEYRIKPKARIIRFRNWLSTDGYVYASQQEDTYKEKYFKEWLGDWQEVEVEE